MEALAAELAQRLSAHASWTAPAVALATFAASLAPVGLLVPVTALMLAAASLVGMGLASPGPVLLAAFAGTASGSALGYELRRAFGARLRRWPSVRRHRRHVARARLLARTYGGWSLAVSRFLGPMRSLVPLVAGSLRMSRTRFAVANVVSALVWALAFLLPGWVARWAS